MDWRNLQNKRIFGNERGAVLALVAILFTVLIGMLAFSIDINHLKVVENELQNAADAGALAGTQALYEDPGGGYLPGEKINTGANQTAMLAGTANKSDNFPVEILTDLTVPCPDPPDDLANDTVDVRRGHWSFANDKFTCIEDTTDPVEIWGIPDEELDLMDGTYEYPPGSGEYPKFVNAVRVRAKREDVEAKSFFAQIYGFLGFKREATAVAYLGFAGSLNPFAVDMPIAICNTSLEHGSCNIGRMINSGNTGTTNNTAAWVELDPYTQSEVDSGQCNSGTNSNAVRSLVDLGCDGSGVNNEVIGGSGGSVWIDANNGDIAAAYNDMKTCWENLTSGESPWEMTLPVVECDGHGIENCVRVIGAVTVNMLLMTPPSVDPDTTTPTIMQGTDDFPDWNSSTDCAFFDQLSAGMYNGALLSGGYNSTVLPDNFQSTVLPLLPGEDYASGDDPWLIEDRWNGVTSSDKEYTPGMARWDCFVDHFQLRNNDGSYAPLAFKSMYFMPSCKYHEPTGESGGSNFGILAKIPKLVD